MVAFVSEVLTSESAASLLSNTFRQYEAAGNDIRVVCDHIAGMSEQLRGRVRAFEYDYPTKPTPSMTQTRSFTSRRLLPNFKHRFTALGTVLRAIAPG